MYKTADLFDQHGDRIQTLEPIFRDYGGRADFHGPVATVKLHEDNSLVREYLQTQGNNRILVVDGGGSLRCALLGDQLAALASQNHWSGLIIYGCVRDSMKLSQMDLGVKALATHPAKSVKQGQGSADVTLRFAGATISPGDYAYADPDGILVSKSKLSPGE